MLKPAHRTGNLARSPCKATSAKGCLLLRSWWVCAPRYPQGSGSTVFTADPLPPCPRTSEFKALNLQLWLEYQCSALVLMTSGQLSKESALRGSGPCLLSSSDRGDNSLCPLPYLPGNSLKKRLLFSCVISVCVCVCVCVRT